MFRQPCTRCVRRAGNAKPSSTARAGRRKEEVLIALDTAGAGSWDAEMRAGWYPGEHPDFPLVLGTDGSGRTVATGSHIRRFRMGDAVYAYSFPNPQGGFYAEYVAVQADG
jgi:NADPH:quinone reductase